MPTQYAFLGGGNMGRAMIGGLIAAGQPPQSIRVADTAAAAREACAKRFAVEVHELPADALRGADVVVLAVKPQQLRELALSLTANQGTLYLSIAAGITIGHLESWLGRGAAIVRAMPNTPALIGCGATVLVANECVSENARAQAGALLSAVGLVEWVSDEAQLDAVTALSGSGPAYFFLFIEALEAAGSELGLPPELARRLAVQTAYGSCRLAHESESTPATLREQVTSPGGTTERALASFAASDLRDVVARALDAAHARSGELARLIER